MERRVSRARAEAYTLVAAIVAVACVLSAVLSRAVTRPVCTVTELMEELGELDSEEHERLERLYEGRGSHIREVSALQHSCAKMSRGIEMFKRYVPNTVVRDIVRGDERAMRLHVSQREVTIMFSDIANFTTIAESLKQVDLLFLLTRYFSIMTRIVETYDGVVAEILGDGLVVFWNTPDDVLDHAAKACAAALAQQKVMEALNNELSTFSLPEIKIRIGLHTGTVLSGNIGSENKMKFGCMGDPVNLASRLEGLCKTYGVSTMLSEATCRAVSRFDERKKRDGFVLRELDLVQVKGKTQPTRIYQLMGISSPVVFAQFETFESAAGHAMQASTQAMREFEDLGWNPLRAMARRFSFQFNESRVFPDAKEKENDKSKDDFSPSASAGRAGTPASKVSKVDSYTVSPRKSQSPKRSPSGSPVPSRQQTLADLREVLASDVGEEAVSADLRTKISAYETALHAYQKARFQEAESKAFQLLSDWPEDVATTMLLEQVRKYVGPDGQVQGLTEEQLSAWTGVTVLSSK